MEILPNGAWMGATDEHHSLDVGIIDPLCELFAGAIVSDFGCGAGLYVDTLAARGISITGYDGNPATQYRYADLSLPFACAPNDWVLSLEVGEHIPPEREQTFIDNVCGSASIGLVLSWATPNQGGRGHVNERQPAYIRSEITRRGFVVDEQATMNLKISADIWYFKRTITVYRKVL